MEEPGSKFWKEIAREFYYRVGRDVNVYRTPKNCHERWGCYLNPAIVKGDWTIVEDFKLLSNFLRLGKKWVLIAKELKDRTENAIKNRFAAILSRKKKRKYPVEDEVFIAG